MFHINLDPPPVFMTLIGIARMELRVSIKAFDIWEPGLAQDLAWSHLWIVFPTRWHTSLAFCSGKVRFSIVHTYGDTGGLKGMAKNVTTGLGQTCLLMRCVAACSDRFATRKHHGAAYRPFGVAAARGAPTAGSGMFIRVEMAVLSFWTISPASGWYPASQG